MKLPLLEIPAILITAGKFQSVTLLESVLSPWEQRV